MHEKRWTLSRNSTINPHIKKAYNTNLNLLHSFILFALIINNANEVGIFLVFNVKVNKNGAFEVILKSYRSLQTFALSKDTAIESSVTPLIMTSL